MNPDRPPTPGGVDRRLVAALLLALGIAAAGWLAGRGFQASRAGDRYVTVKGVSEREVRADLAFWPLRLIVADDDLGRAQARLRSQVELVTAFLARHQLDTTAIELQGFSVTDAYTNQYRQGATIGNRYVIRQVVMVRSADPDRVLGASQQVGELVSAGVVLSSGDEYGPGGPSFIFTRLSDLKPPMIAEATARARESAEQFARDSHSELAGIRRASQGVFEILPRDQAPGIEERNQIVKTVRVVSTIEYQLRH
jgi:hypothetical protein